MPKTGRKILSLTPKEPTLNSGLALDVASAQKLCKADRARILENLALNLANPTSSRSFQATIRYMLFRLIEKNKGITLAKLKRYFVSTYLVDKKAVDAAIGSLIASTLFDCVSKWQNPKCAHLGTEIGSHLFVKDTLPGPFESWLSSVRSEYPELKDYVAESIVNLQPVPSRQEEPKP